jgi:hypothetical protein
VLVGSAASRERRQGKLSSNHRERARFVSPRRRRQLSRRAHRALVPSPKLFAATYFTAYLSIIFCIVQLHRSPMASHDSLPLRRPERERMFHATSELVGDGRMRSEGPGT